LKSKKRYLSLSILLLIVNTFLVPLSPQEGDKSEARKRWEKALESNPISVTSKKLLFKFSYPADPSEENEIYIVQGSNLCADIKKDIYVSDSRDHAILKFDIKGNFIKRLGRKGQGPGELINPLDIFCNEGLYIFVLDDGNRRINKYDTEGKIQSSFKYFKSYNSFGIRKSDKIYASYFSINPEDPLIDVLDLKGNVIKSFGKRIKFNKFNKAKNEVLLSLNDNGDIYVVWKNLDHVRKYSKEGELLIDLNINYKPINEIAKKNLNMEKNKQGNLEMYNLIMGMRTKKNGFYLFRSYPRIEILEFNDNGEIEDIFWHETEFSYIPGDFLVIRKNNSIDFHILQQYPESEIDVFGIKKN